MDFDRTIIHPHRYAEMILTKRVSEQLPGTRIKTQYVSYPVELRLRHFKRIERSSFHNTSELWLFYITLSSDAGTELKGYFELVNSKPEANFSLRANNPLDLCSRLREIGGSRQSLGVVFGSRNLSRICLQTTTRETI
jgi:hypothetical protein